MRVCVVGLGKIGLPLACEFASNGFQVTGVDKNELLVSQLNDSEIPSTIIEPGLSELLHELRTSNRIRFLSALDTAVIQSDVVIVIVPLLLDSEGKPDFANLDQVTHVIGENLHEGHLIIYETTLPIGTTRNRFWKMLQQESGLGEDAFSVAFSPERVFTGAFRETIRQVPKIVGGCNSDSLEKAARFYSKAIQFSKDAMGLGMNGIIKVSSVEAAEFCKLAETTYRDVNIALANSFGLDARSMGLDMAEIVVACNSQPFSHIHTPGLNVGGHCIPVYPKLYLSSFPDNTVIAHCRRFNESMPSRYVELLEGFIGSLENLNVLVLGVSYRPGVKESYASGAFDLRDILSEKGSHVKFLDPYFSTEELSSLGLNAADELFLPDVLIFQTAHSLFKSISRRDYPSVRAVVDGRNFISSENWPGCELLSLASPLQTFSPSPVKVQ